MVADTLKKWWAPDKFAARRPNLEIRMAILAAVRRLFKDGGFYEVETPALQVCPGLEPHLTAFSTELAEPFGGERRAFYLHTSPEFAMKKLLVAGVPRLFQLARVFRNGERSATHHPEFTMLEWYRVGAGIRDLMADCKALLHACVEALPQDKKVFRWNGHVCDPHAPWRRITVAGAFEEYCGIDLIATAPDPLAPDKELLAAQARRVGIAPGREENWEKDRWEDIFFRIFLDRIEPNLGIGGPTILYDYPLSMAATARPSPADPRLAERFELYICGLELANGFAELSDAREQRRRFERDVALKREIDGAAYPVDEDFIAALEYGMPESAGIALGFDRLVMLATGAAAIEDVLWAPVE